MQTGSVSAFVGFTFPHDCRVLKDVTYKIVLLNKTEANWKRVGGTSSFYKSPAPGSGQGHEWGTLAIVKVSDMLLPEAGWLNDQGELQFRATATIPLEASAPCPAFCAQLDLSQDLAPVTFHLPDGPPLIFDKRLLVARSEYFKEMLSEDKWKESRTNEIDLTKNSEASHAAFGGVLRFLLGGLFQSQGNMDYAFSVRRLADQYRLTELVQQVDIDLERILSEGNALQLLGQTVGSGGFLESACLDMLKENECELLKLQKHKIAQIMRENPLLAEKLMELLLDVADTARAQKRTRVSR